ncbi:NAD(P)-binding protein [Lentinus tigrinus ALCF2SS1-7]|uniref:NAD(P)-binding protein n=1 Tax=Lentinus tigrinus ALCF2SS1-6 TaxID=1328759 RepID=A0A5C2RTM8_9APHY|nr:NAD(P)-binding protein [Lentinus tigrinus ALCF2SS1-6]RPD69287.1 NAD(P)-binding protein [Lentinus tigrinus ALCF2SS1-7]
MVGAVKLLAVLGGVLAVPHLCRISSFVWLYFLRPSSLRRYLHGPSPYALITGATDGIGKALARELLRNGFNLILHGRNETKMKKVVEELRKSVPDKPDADIRYFIADASQAGHDFTQMIETFKDLHITLVYHNVGGSDTSPERLDERTEDYLYAMLHKNTLFALFLNRVLLPHLRRSAKSGPVLVQFMGSLAGDVAPPRLSIYAASKGFLESLSHGLDNDELFFDGPTGVRYAYLVAGPVQTGPMGENFRTPSCETFAKAVMARTGCGGRRVVPYAVHAVLLWFMGNVLGDAAVDRFSAEEIRSLIEQAKKGE